MSILRPTYMCDKLTDVKSELLKELGISAVLLDVDNTLSLPDSGEPMSGTVEWSHEMTEKGFKLVIVSNNYDYRVKPFAEKYGLDYIVRAYKPLPNGYLKAKKMLDVKAKDCVIIGDQIYTDIIGANLCGMKSILLNPFELETTTSFKIRRTLEKGPRKRYQKRQEKIEASKTKNRVEEEHE